VGSTKSQKYKNKKVTETPTLLKGIPASVKQIVGNNERVLITTLTINE